MKPDRTSARVPRYSQFLDVRDPAWRHRACGVVALETVLDFYDCRPPSAAAARIAALIRRGARGGAYDPLHGWRHAGLVRLARHRGFRARRFDWSGRSSPESYRDLRTLAAAGPVIVSVRRNLAPGSSGHLVVVTHAGSRVVSYHDPDSSTRTRVPRRAGTKRFLGGWKRRGIVVRPR